MMVPLPTMIRIHIRKCSPARLHGRVLAAAFALALALAMATAAHAAPAGPLPAPADGDAAPTLRMKAQDMPVRAVFEQIAAETGWEVENLDALDGAGTVSFNFVDMPVETMVQLVAGEAGASALVHDGVIRIGSVRDD